MHANLRRLTLMTVGALCATILSSCADAEDSTDSVRPVIKARRFIQRADEFYCCQIKRGRPWWAASVVSCLRSYGGVRPNGFLSAGRNVLSTGGL